MSETMFHLLPRQRVVDRSLQLVTQADRHSGRPGSAAEGAGLRPIRRYLRIAAFATALTVAPGVVLADEPVPAAALPAEAGPTTALTPEAVITLAIGHSPSLKAAVVEAKRASLSVTGEEERYLPTLTAGLDYSHTARPSLNTSGVSLGTSDAVTGTVGVVQQFPWGTSLAAQLSLSGSQSGYVQPGMPAALALGPGYGVNLNVTLTQPLLRGSGRTEWESALRSARISARAARTGEQEAASAAARDVLAAYWELWYAQAAERIQEQALETTRRQLEDAQGQVSAGARAKFDLLPLRTQVASIDEARVAAQTTVAVKRVALARLIGQLGASQLVVAPAPPAEIGSPPDVGAATAAALARAYSLADLRAAVDQARLNADVAGEKTRIKLDAGAWVTVAGLGNARVDDAFSQFGSFGAVSGGVSLSLELPTDRTTIESEAATARLSVDTAKARLQDAEEQLAQQAAELVATLNAARSRVEFAQQTAALAGETLDGQKDRFTTGVGTATELVISEQDKREAELRVARARVDVEDARLSLAHLTGDLLPQVAPER